MIKILGNIGLGLLVTATIGSLIAGTVILVMNIFSNYVFNLENAKMTLLVGMVLVFSYFIGEISKREFIKHGSK